jgi:hypothetical protein
MSRDMGVDFNTFQSTKTSRIERIQNFVRDWKKFTKPHGANIIPASLVASLTRRVWVHYFTNKVASSISAASGFYSSLLWFPLVPNHQTRFKSFYPKNSVLFSNAKIRLEILSRNVWWSSACHGSLNLSNSQFDHEWTSSLT